MQEFRETAIGEAADLSPTADVGQQKPKKNFKWSVNYYGILFVLPFFIVYGIFSLFPMVYSVFLSITDYEGYNRVISIIGFEHFGWLLTQARFWQSLLNTVMIFCMNFVPQMSFALIFAAMFTGKTYKMRGKGTFKAIYYLPNIIPRLPSPSCSTHCLRARAAAFGSCSSRWA